MCVFKTLERERKRVATVETYDEFKDDKLTVKAGLSTVRKR